MYRCTIRINRNKIIISTRISRRAECLLFSGHLLAVLRSVILPSIIQINARSRVSLVKINAHFFSEGICPCSLT